jgi:hypothetical protein
MYVDICDMKSGGWGGEVTPNFMTVKGLLVKTSQTLSLDNQSK